MKGVIFIALLLAAAASTNPVENIEGADDCGCVTTPPPKPTVRCPQCVTDQCTPNMCNLAVLLPYPGDCSKFCVCDSLGAIEMDCPAGTLFSPSLGQCVWPEDAGCSNDDPYPGCTATTTTTPRPTTTRTTTLKPTSTTTTTPRPTSTTTTTPRPTSTTTTTPRPTSTTTTTPRPTSTTTTTPRPTTTVPDDPTPTLPCQTDPPKPTVKCPECVNQHCSVNMCNQAVPIPFPNDCNKFCLCDLSGSIEMQCPPGLVFSPEQHVCVWPNEWACSNDDPYPGCPRKSLF